MKFVAFVQPGVGSSDAVLDWLEQQEIVAVVRNVDRDEGALAEALALAGGRLPVVRVGDRVVAGFDPAGLESLASEGAAPPAGLLLAADPDGRVIVQAVIPGGRAELAGFQSGDVITKLGGYTIFSVDQIRKALDRPRASRLSMEVRRGEEVVNLRVQVPFRLV